MKIKAHMHFILKEKQINELGTEHVHRNMHRQKTSKQKRRRK